jgi:hypothetical protein
MKPTDFLSIAGRLPAQAITGATNTNSVDLQLLRGVAAVCIVGAATTPPSFTIQSSADNTTFTNITGKSIASIPANSEAVINIRDEELPDGHRWIRAVVNGNATVAVLFVGTLARDNPPAKLASTTIVG